MEGHDETLRRKVVAAYRDAPNAVVDDVAERFKVSKASVLRWKAQAGCFKPRGRRALIEPNERQREILRLAVSMTYAEIGKHLGISKQAVGRICKQWQGWHTPKHPPFKVGDVINVRGKHYTVVKAGVRSGTVRDSDGQVAIIPWFFKGRHAQLVKSQ